MVAAPAMKCRLHTPCSSNQIISRPVILLALLAAACLFLPSSGQAVIVGTTYQTTEPTDSDVTHWQSGWGATGVTGWDYVGLAGDASGVYLGNGWVLTADHVDISNLTYVLGGVSYQIISSSISSLKNSTADLSVFQITSSSGLPSLPKLTISSFAPVVDQTEVVLVGFGNTGTKVESWGMNVVTGANQTVAITNTTWVSTDFSTTLGSVNTGSGTYTNAASVVNGDSGGAAFYYNSFTHKWELMGIMEAVNGDTSYMIQLSQYKSLITAAVPEPSTWALAAAGVAFMVLLRRRA